MPNHFHFLIQVRDEEEILKNLAGFRNLQGLKNLNRQFSNFFNSYAKAFNKMFERTGKLFRNSMKLKEVTDEDYLVKLIHYIHLNPVFHGFVTEPSDWKFSSFHAYTNSRETLLEEDAVMDLFKGRDGFYEYHKRKIDEGLLDELEL